MTGYHLRLGYNAATRTDDEQMWAILKAEARRVADDPAAIIAEARRLGSPETCDDGCCCLDNYADNYAEPFGWDGHPVKVIDIPGNRQILQMASSDSAVKYHVRRAYVRLLIEAMHKQAIEISLSVV